MRYNGSLIVRCYPEVSKAFVFLLRRYCDPNDSLGWPRPCRLDVEEAETCSPFSAISGLQQPAYTDRATGIAKTFSDCQEA